MTKLSRRGAVGGLGAAAVLASRRAKAAGNLVIWWGRGSINRRIRP